MQQCYLPGIDLSTKALTATAVRFLRQVPLPDDLPFWGCFSGGKDSCVIKELAQLAGVPVEWHYNVTTIDPPELVRFIRREHPDVSFDRPPENFFTVAKRRGFPTRRVRWCCEEFKERRSPPDRVLIFGVRHEESPRRKEAWQLLTYHRRTKAYVASPIVHWTSKQVWEFIRSHELPYCSLYDEGFKRLGCIGCPMASCRNREIEFARWPGYEKKWKDLFRFTWERRTGSKQRDGRIWFGDRYFDSWEEMWDWWMSGGSLPKQPDPCQGMLDMFS